MIATKAAQWVNTELRKDPSVPVPPVPIFLGPDMCKADFGMTQGDLLCFGCGVK